MTKTMTTIKPADEFGAVLAGRTLAARMREQVEAAAVESDVVIDFAGIEMMSPSFADELIAKLPRDLLGAGRIRIEHLSDEIASLARFVIAGR